MTEEPTGSIIQKEIYRETGDLAEVVRRMLERSELSRTLATSPTGAH
jgi:hypothetical protein